MREPFARVLAVLATAISCASVALCSVLAREVNRVRGDVGDLRAWRADVLERGEIVFVSSGGVVYRVVARSR